MQDSWNELLQRLGIAKSFTDAAQNRRVYEADDDTLLKMVNALGFKLDKKEDSGKLLAKLDKRRWLYGVETIYVVRQQSKVFDVVLPETDVDDLELTVKNKLTGEDVVVEYQQTKQEEKTLGKVLYSRVALEIVSDMEPGYYELLLQTNSDHYHTILAVTPDKCYESEILQQKKIWGVAVQLYSLTSSRNWGVGDFTDLANLVKICQRQGADIIGLNPLNVLFHDFPENASPYSSISRLFLNPIYIDVEKVSGYKPDMIAEKKDVLQHFREEKIIDYASVYQFKMEVLTQIFETVYENPEAEDYNSFMAFCQAKGADLDDLATYQAIYSSLCYTVYGGWCAWPKDLQNPHSADVAKFKADHQKEISFFKYLQFLADKQLQEVSAEVHQAGLQIGLYRDLPVGLCKDSAELWSGYDLFIKNCGAGAPPDVFFPKGQKWCLGAFNPYRLKESAYLPFIKILRTAMEGAGAIRIDHVMSLMRLYVIPDNADTGTYVYYNFEDMLGIVALESYLHHCMVVGESIGNVPDGFIEKIHERGIYSLSVLWSERWNGDGAFKLPQDFSKKSFCSIGTHDMAPLKMRWFGYDIEVMYRLKMINDEERRNMYLGREKERRCLLDALDYTNSWSPDRTRQGDCLYGEGYPNGIMEATERYTAASDCAVFLAQPEDIFGVVELQNLPGTDRDKHPNWRRKVPVLLEDFEKNEDFLRAVRAINR